MLDGRTVVRFEGWNPTRRWAVCVTMGKGVKTIMVILESLAGTGHKLVRLRPKIGDKLEEIALDPYVQKQVLYRELKKIRTLKTK